MSRHTVSYKFKLFISFWLTETLLNTCAVVERDDEIQKYKTKQSHNAASDRSISVGRRCMQPTFPLFLSLFPSL